MRVADQANSKYAYRWGVLNDAGDRIYTTMPAVTKVVPTIKSAVVSKRRLKRQERFNTTVTTDVPIYGNVRIEYQLGTRWIQVSRNNIKGAKKFTVPGRIDRTSGSFPIRVRLDGMSAAGRPWYDTTSKPLGKVTVLSEFIVRR